MTITKVCVRASVKARQQPQVSGAAERQSGWDEDGDDVVASG